MPTAHDDRLCNFVRPTAPPITRTATPNPINAVYIGRRSGGGAATGASTGLPQAFCGSGSPGSMALVNAATGETTPAPTRLSSPRAGLCAVSTMRRITWCAVSLGNRARTNAATPATTGAEKLVPLMASSPPCLAGIALTNPGRGDPAT